MEQLEQNKFYKNKIITKETILELSFDVFFYRFFGVFKVLKKIFNNYQTEGKI